MIDIAQPLKNGSLYAGPHPVYTKRFLLCKEEDQPDTMTWPDAYSIKGSFKLPSFRETMVLAAYYAFLGINGAWYWSSLQVNGFHAWAYNCIDGEHILDSLNSKNCVRLVKTVTQEELEALV